MAAASPVARRLGTACLLAAGAGALLLIVAGRQSGQSWLPSYLFVWLFVLGLSLGSLAWVVVHNLTGGDWGQAARPFLQAALRLFPLTALLALPLLFAPAQLLPWMHTAAGAPERGFRRRPALVSELGLFLRAGDRSILPSGWGWPGCCATTVLWRRTAPVGASRRYRRSRPSALFCTPSPRPLPRSTGRCRLRRVGIRPYLACSSAPARRSRRWPAPSSAPTRWRPKSMRRCAGAFTIWAICRWRWCWCGRIWHSCSF